MILRPCRNACASAYRVVLAYPSLDRHILLVEVHQSIHLSQQQNANTQGSLQLFTEKTDYGLSIEFGLSVLFYSPWFNARQSVSSSDSSRVSHFPSSKLAQNTMSKPQKLDVKTLLDWYVLNRREETTTKDVLSPHDRRARALATPPA